MTKKARWRSGSPGFPLPQELPASTKQEEDDWGRLGGIQVGTSIVGLQQVVSLCSCEADRTPPLSVSSLNKHVYYNLLFSGFLFVSLEKVLRLKPLKLRVGVISVVFSNCCHALSEVAEV